MPNLKTVSQFNKPQWHGIVNRRSKFDECAEQEYFASMMDLGTARRLGLRSNMPASARGISGAVPERARVPPLRTAGKTVDGIRFRRLSTLRASFLCLTDLGSLCRFYPYQRVTAEKCQLIVLPRAYIPIRVCQPSQRCAFHRSSVLR